VFLAKYHIFSRYFFFYMNRKPDLLGSVAQSCLLHTEWVSGSDLRQNSRGCLPFISFFTNQKYDGTGRCWASFQNPGSGWLAGSDPRAFSPKLQKHQDMKLYFCSLQLLQYYYFINIIYAQKQLVFSLVTARGGLRNSSSMKVQAFTHLTCTTYLRCGTT